MTNDYKFVGRIPAKWADEIVGNDTYLKRDDPRISDLRELIKIYNRKGNNIWIWEVDLILAKY